MQAGKLTIVAVTALGLAVPALVGSAQAAAGIAPGWNDLGAQGKSGAKVIRYRGGPIGLSGSHANFGRPGVPDGFGWYGPGWGGGWPFLGIGVWGNPGWGGYDGYGYRGCRYPGCGW